MICRKKGVAIEWREINRFDDQAPDSYSELYPFHRVPVL
jgi:glutathione S-transferase